MSGEIRWRRAEPRASRRRPVLVRFALFLVVALVGWRGVAAYARQESPPSPPAFEVDLQGRIKDLKLVEIDGSLFVRPQDGAAPVRGEEWLRALQTAQEHQREQGFLYVLFNITKPWSFAWIAIGFAGQALFTMRMVVQWLASEKEKRSVIPVAFWWGSLFGGILLFVYFVWRKDIVGTVGQSTGIVVYARNLILIHRRAPAAN